jgi:hypothetical protein
MRQDQLDRFKELSIKVADVVLIDTDPENWTGYREAPKDMDKETRGNARWDRALAAQSLQVLFKLIQIVGNAPASEAYGARNGDMTEVEAEAEAVALLDRVQTRRGG